jgi:uncharacterized repeat protein (TIGR04076 family)
MPLYGEKEDSKRHAILVVKEIRGFCPVYKRGDIILINRFFFESKKSANICIHAFSSMSTLLSAFVHGVSAKDLGIGSEDDVGYLQCPDPGPPYTSGGTVVFELRRGEYRERGEK